jgi:osmotically-inducible protein OsmY
MVSQSIPKILILASGVLAFSGCTSTARSDYSEAGRKATHAIESAGKAVDADATALGHKLSDTVSESSSSNDQVSEKVRRALLGATDIQTSGLSVSTSGHKVILRGRIRSEVENQQAEHIARDAAGKGFTVDDQLNVREG